MVNPFSKFAGYTTSHGIPHIKRVENRLGRAVWALLTILAYVLVAFLMATKIMFYMSYPKDITSETVEVNSLSFPAVRICNANPFRLSKVQDLLNTTDMYDDLFKDFVNTNNTEYDPEKGMKLQRAMARSPSKTDLSHQLSDMLINCRFGSEPCDQSDFIQTYDPQEGNCYTFNGDMAKDKILKTDKVGPKYGLTLTLFSQIHEYIPVLASTSGFKVAVYDQKQKPDPETSGFLISAGFQTQISLQPITTKRLPPPYGMCEPGDREENDDKETEASRYSKAGCFMSCHQKAVIEACGCHDDLLPVPEGGTTRTCYSDPDLNTCQEKLHQEFAETGDTSKKCDCPVPCGETKYQGQNTQVLFPVPDDAFIVNYAKNLAKKNSALSDWIQALEAQGADKPVTASKIRSGLLQIHMFYDDLAYTVNEQKPATDIASLIMDIGIYFAVILGVSMLTLFEFLELIGRLFAYCFSGCKDDGTSTDEAKKATSNGMGNTPYMSNGLYTDAPKQPAAGGASVTVVPVV